MATPTLKAITPTVPEANLPHAPEPVIIYGLGAGGNPTFTQLTGEAAGATGSNLQDILNGLVSRIVALETP